MSDNKIETLSQKVELVNLNRFHDIFEKCFGFKAPDGYFEWKYAQNPVGSLIAFEEVNKDTNEVGAFYGITPELYSVDGQRKIIYQSMDTMTHPNYRNRGLFIKLAKLTYDYTFQNTGQLDLIGIPGSNSYHGFVKKLEWKNPIDFYYIFQHRLILKSLSLFSSKKVNLEEIKDFDEEIDVFFQEQVHYKKIYKIFNKDILNWKISKHPFNKYKSFKIRLNGKMIGLIIVQIEKENLKIIYVDFLDNETKQYLKETVLQITTQFKFKFLYSWNSTDQEMTRQFNRIQFIKNPFKKGAFSYRVPLILLSRNVDEHQKTSWEKASNFELQPIIQD